MSSALTEAAAGPAGKEGPGGGEGHFLHRKRLGPSEAWGRRSLASQGSCRGSMWLERWRVEREEGPA